MNIETVRSVLLWSGILNYGFLILWLLVFVFARDFLHRKSAWFGLSTAHFDLIQYAGITGYKAAIFFFNLVPYLAILLVG